MTWCTGVCVASSSSGFGDAIIVLIAVVCWPGMTAVWQADVSVCSAPCSLALTIPALRH